MLASRMPYWTFNWGVQVESLHEFAQMLEFPFQHSPHDPLVIHDRISTLTPLSVITLCQHGQGALFGSVFGINIDTSGMTSGILW